MKRTTVISSSILIVTGFHAALAQPPGGGGRGGFTPPTFDSMNRADADGNKDDYLTLEEVEAWFAERFTGRGGGEFDAETVFAQWDTQPEGAPDGRVTREEFDARPMGPGRGRAGPGGAAPPR